MCVDCRENDVFSEQSMNMTREYIIQSKGDPGEPGVPGEVPTPIFSDDLFST